MRCSISPAAPIAAPLTQTERADLLAYYRTLREKDGLSHEDAMRDSLVAVLVSPDFAYRIDLVDANDRIRPLDDFALASRLSYFLWASMPDDELLAVAARGELQAPGRAGAAGEADAEGPARARVSSPSSAATSSTSAGSKSTTPSIASGSRHSTTSCARRCSKSRCASCSTWSARTAR